MAHNKLLILSSDGQRPSRFEVEYNQTIDVRTQRLAVDDQKTEPVHKIVSYTIALDSGYVPMFISNIHTRYSNTSISFTIDGSTEDLIIPNGLYNIQQLNEWLQKELFEAGYYEAPSSDNGYETLYPFSIQKESATGRAIIQVDDALLGPASITINSALAKMLGFDSSTTFGDGYHVSDKPSNMEVSRPINIHVDIVDSTWKNEVKSDIISTFLPSMYYGQMMNITPIERKYLPLAVGEISRVGVRFSYSDNTEVVFDRDDVPVVLNLHIQRTTI